MLADRRFGWAGRALTLVVAAALAGGPAIAQIAPQSWPRPPDRPLVGEPAWAHAEGRQRLWRELVELFEGGYWDPDHLAWREWGDRHREAVVAAEDRPALDAAFARMVREVGDDHSSWVGLSGAEPQREPTPPPGTPRLGVQLAFVEGRGLVIERVYAGTPAAAAGLRRADVITAAGAVDMRGFGSLFEANAALADALLEGTAVLRVERGRLGFAVEVEAAAVAFGDVASRPYAVMLDQAVGYLHVPSFSDAGTGAMAHAALRELVAEGATALVLDLRGNLGGRLVEAGLVVGALLEGAWARATARGELAWTATYAVERGSGGRDLGVSRLVEPDGSVLGEARVVDPARFRGPVVVVVGAESASAGEIVAAALADLGRARVVGEATAGNVEAVRAHALSDGSRVLVAIARVEGVDGTPYHLGVRPEVLARAAVLDLARGLDPPVAEARRLLGGLPFTPGRLF